jgi:hypothetical protein
VYTHGKGPRPHTGAQALFLDDIEARKLQTLLRLDARGLEELLRLLPQLKAMLAMKGAHLQPANSKSIPDPALARQLGQMVRSRGQAYMAEKLGVSEKSIQRYVKTQRFGAKMHAELRKRIYKFAIRGR